MTKYGITLAAQDGEDLQLISARLQDAVAQVQNLSYLPKERRFAGLFNRFRWEAKDDTRIRAGLYINGVLGCRTFNLNRDVPDAVVSLLAVQFLPAEGEDPGGQIVLILSGGGAIKLEVECLDAGLTDIGAPWAALGRPAHET